jgi:Carboxypeptidase regulatory-like domain
MRILKSFGLLGITLILPQILTAVVQTPSGSVRGVVVSRDGSVPLGGTTVELQPATETSRGRITTTDDDGKFVFSKVPTGSYRVLARRSSFVSAQYGQRGPNSPGQVLVLAEGQNVDLRIAMTATGSISGRIIWKEGKPMANARVIAMKASYQENRRVLTAVRETVTDDTGEYRLFWLSPGQYFVNVTIPDGPIATPLIMNPEGNDVRGLYEGRAQLFPIATTPVGSGAAENEAHVPTFFPGTGNGSLAKAIEVAPRADIRGIDITALPLRTHRVRGSLANGTAGTPPGANAQVRLLPSAPNSGPQYQVAADASTGGFEFPKVVPGSYVVYSTVGGANGPKGRALLEVVDQDIENISLIMTAGFSLPVQVRVEGTAAATAELTRLRVSLRPDPAITGLPSPGVAPSAEGVAAIAGIIAGGYRLYVSPFLNAPGAAIGALPNAAVPAGMQSFYVKSARFGAQDVLNNGFVLDAQPEGSLEIVIGTNPGALAGRVTTAAEGMRVVLIPDEGQSFRLDAYKSTFSGAAGQFRFQRIPPGAYHIYVWDDVANDAWFDPDFMRTQDGRGMAVIIREGANPDVSLNP